MSQLHIDFEFLGDVYEHGGTVRMLRVDAVDAARGRIRGRVERVWARRGEDDDIPSLQPDGVEPEPEKVGAEGWLDAEERYEWTDPHVSPCIGKIGDALLVAEVAVGQRVLVVRSHAVGMRPANPTQLRKVEVLFVPAAREEYLRTEPPDLLWSDVADADLLALAYAALRSRGLLETRRLLEACTFEARGDAPGCAPILHHFSHVSREGAAMFLTEANAVFASSPNPLLLAYLMEIESHLPTNESGKWVEELGHLSSRLDPLVERHMDVMRGWDYRLASGDVKLTRRSAAAWLAMIARLAVCRPRFHHDIVSLKKLAPLWSDEERAAWLRAVVPHLRQTPMMSGSDTFDSHLLSEIVWLVRTYPSMGQVEILRVIGPTDRDDFFQMKTLVGAIDQMAETISTRYPQAKRLVEAWTAPVHAHKEKQRAAKVAADAAEVARDGWRIVVPGEDEN